MKKLFALLLALVMVLCCACGEKEEPREEDPTAESIDYAPDFQVYDRQGNAVKLSDMRGKPVVLNFWATWCGPCKSELPAFQQAYETYGDNVVFMMVDMVQGRTETKAGAIEYVDGQGYTFPLYFDEDQNAVETYEIAAVPASYFLNAEGEIVAHHVGAMSFDQLEGFIQQIHQ